jgi:hypothetical protein
METAFGVKAEAEEVAALSELFEHRQVRSNLIGRIKRESDRRPLSSMIYAAYAIDVLVDPEEVRKVNLTTKRHLAYASGELSSAISTVNAWLTKWVWETNGAPEREAQLEMVGSLREVIDHEPSWPKPYLLAFDLMATLEMASGALGLLERLAAVRVPATAVQSTFRDAVDYYFTGRLGWDERSLETTSDWIRRQASDEA